ncbi:MAG: hypothetical protein JXJ20_11215 [Anaerolineae bacterium]|jgi:tetratricopeptide (TPR) repeat protein|nr:hypothetical protein [Anaerolineae bacterium]
MTTLSEHIDILTDRVMNGSRGLDEVLDFLERWINDHAATLTATERKQFDATVDAGKTTSINYSLVNNVLRLHTARLLYRLDAQQAAPPAPDDKLNPYEQAREDFHRVFKETEQGINEAQIDLAIANAHQFLGNINAKRNWLDTALKHLPSVAAVDLTSMARSMPAMPLPRSSWLRRIGINLILPSLERLAEQHRDDLAQIAYSQANQIILLAHLIGTSFESIHERQRAGRAFRVAAHLIVRNNGMQSHEDPAQLLDMAEPLHAYEPEAARVLAQQARDLCVASPDDDSLARANAILYT